MPVTSAVETALRRPGTCLPPISNRLQSPATGPRDGSIDPVARSDRQTKEVQMISQKHIKATLALAVVTSALGPVAALARPLPADPSMQAAQPSVEVVKVSSNTGFDWGDAG